MTKRRLFIVGLLLVGLLTGLILWSISVYQQKNQLLIQRLQYQSQMQILTALLIKELGYSGFIHNFKNYVLRGDESYYAAARQNMSRIERFLYESNQNIDNPNLELYYRRLFDTLSQYKANLELVARLKVDGLSTTEIDQRVRVDDTEASVSLRVLIDQYQTQQKKSLEQMQEYNDSVLEMLTLLICATLLLSISSSLVLVYYIRSANRKEDVVVRLSARQKLLDAAPNPILVVAESGQIKFANDGAAALFETEKSNLMDVSLESLMPESMRSQHERFRHLFFSSGGKRTMINPVPLHTFKGQIREVEVCIGQFEVEGERYAVANLVDVSEMTAYRKRLEGVEKKFRTTFEIVPIGIAHVDMDGHFMQVNPHFAGLLGFSCSELEGKTLDAFSIQEPETSHGEIVERLTREDMNSYRVERRLQHRDGRIVVCNVITTLSRDWTGLPQYLIEVVEDITQRKYYEQHLLNSEKKFKTIAQYVNGVVWMSMPGFSRLLYVSEAYERVWQRSRESLYSMPRSFTDAVVPEDRQRVVDELKKHEQGEWKIRYRIERPDGTTRYIQDEGAPVWGEDGEILYLVGLARDVTDEQVFRERLENTNLQLERLAKFDPLTMTIRRQYALTDLDECLALFKRYKTDATLIFVDLDEFKQVNDQYGHETGDEVLMEFARVVRNFLRETDTFYRYAGDEFLILLRETSAEEARSVIEKMERHLPSVHVGLGKLVKINFSCGVASLAIHGSDNARDWIRAADEQMYESKRMKKVITVSQAQ